MEIASSAKIDTAGKVPQKKGMMPHEWVLLGGALVVSLGLWLGEGDIVMNRWAMETLTGQWQALMGILSWAGQGFIQFLLCGGMGIYYYSRCRYALSRAWWWAFPIFAVGGLMCWPLKTILGRPRPKLWHGEGLYDIQWLETAARFHSFPSGHTATSFALAAAVIGMYGLPGRIFWISFACITAFGRIGIGAHWPADVVFGAAIGWVVGRYMARRLGLG